MLSLSMVNLFLSHAFEPHHFWLFHLQLIVCLVLVSPATNTCMLLIFFVVEMRKVNTFTSIYGLQK